MRSKDLEDLLKETEALDEKSTPPKPPGKGWQMVFGKWVKTGKITAPQEPKGSEPPPEETKPPKKGKIARAKEKVKKGLGLAKKAVKAAPGAAKKAAKAAPGAIKKFMTDGAHRKAIGKKAASTLRRKAKAVVADVKHEFKEFKEAGAAIGKLAKHEKLTPHDKKAMKAAIKAIAMTVGGTLAMGGIGHLGVTALAQHFAAETAVKAVGKAAMFAHVLYEAEGGDEAAFDAWAHKMIKGIADQMEGLGDMSPEQLKEIMGASADEAPEDEEPEAEPEDKEPEAEPEAEPEGAEEPEKEPEDPTMAKLKRKYAAKKIPQPLNTGPREVN